MTNAIHPNHPVTSIKTQWSEGRGQKSEKRLTRIPAFSGTTCNP